MYIFTTTKFFTFYNYQKLASYDYQKLASFNYQKLASYNYHKMDVFTTIWKHWYPTTTETLARVCPRHYLPASNPLPNTVCRTRRPAQDTATMFDRDFPPPFQSTACVLGHPLGKWLPTLACLRYKGNNELFSSFTIKPGEKTNTRDFGFGRHGNGSIGFGMRLFGQFV